MKLEIELREGFNPTDFENLKATLTKFMVNTWKEKGFTDSPKDEGISFNIVVCAPTEHYYVPVSKGAPDQMQDLIQESVDLWLLKQRADKQSKNENKDKGSSL